MKALKKDRLISQSEIPDADVKGRIPGQKGRNAIISAVIFDDNIDKTGGDFRLRISLESPFAYTGEMTT